MATVQAVTHSYETLVAMVDGEPIDIYTLYEFNTKEEGAKHHVHDMTPELLEAVEQSEEIAAQRAYDDYQDHLCDVCRVDTDDIPF